MAGRHRLALRRHRPALDLTGARREEVGQLTWGEVQGDMITLEGPRTKNGKAHLIPLSAPALELLQVRPAGLATDYVFTLDGLKPVSSWGRAKVRLDKASGVTGWRVHDLRRTVATGMQRLGAGLQTVEALLGHTAGSRAGDRRCLPATRLCRREARRRRAVGRARHGSDRGR